MGGQACVFYGAAEFSRDIDLVILADHDNLNRLNKALDELGAVPIAVPPLLSAFLEKGHAVHFRCGGEDVSRLRIDVMSRLRGVDYFPSLWDRRTTIETEGVEIDLLSIEDLVLAKKTQRDKDWPIIRRLVEQHYREHQQRATEADIRFWLSELRTPELLREVIARHPEQYAEAAKLRPALNGDLDHSLGLEEDEERARDREYWKPLREELEQLRFAKRNTV